MLEGPISTRDRLLSRPDVDDVDIPHIIARADTMQSEAKAKLEGRASVDDVIAVGRELDIEEEYVEAAIDELRAEREPKPPTPRPTSSSRQWLPWLALGLGALGLVSLLPPPSVDQQPAPEPLQVEAPEELSVPERAAPEVDEPRQGVVPPPPPAIVPVPVALSELQEASEVPCPTVIDGKALARTFPQLIGKEIRLRATIERSLDITTALVVADQQRFAVLVMPDSIWDGPQLKTFAVFGTTIQPISGATKLPYLMLVDEPRCTTH